jgi:predicted permease
MVHLPNAVYGGGPDGKKVVAFWDRLGEQFNALPGVVAAGIISCPPLSCHWGNFFVAEGQPPRRPDETNPVVLYRPASAGYFKAMGIRLKSGRFLEHHDGRRGDHVAVVNETFARTFWPGVADPVGRRFKGAGDPKAPWVTVVGYVQDVKHYGLERPMRPAIYVPMTSNGFNAMAVVVRTADDPAAFTATARDALRQLDPELPMFRVRTMDDAMKRSLLQRTTYSWLLGIFAVVTLLLALGGTYGVTSYLVSQRTREIGIRVALGARKADIVRTVLRASLVVVGVGVVAGLVASVGLARFLSDLLFGVAPHDARILTGAAVVLVVAAIAANALPARRAADVDPMKSLRAD